MTRPNTPRCARKISTRPKNVKPRQPASEMWPLEEFLEFLRLTEKPEGALSWDEFHQQVLSHPLLEQLYASDNFRAAYEKFSEEHGRAKSGKFADQFAEIRFLHIVADRVGVYSLAIAHGLRPRIATIRRVKETLTHLARLEALLDEGIYLPDSKEDTALRHYLAKLQIYLREDLLRKRQPKEDATLSERLLVSRLAHDFENAFGDALPAVVCDLVNMIGYEADEPAIRKQIRAGAGAIRAGERARPKKTAKKAVTGVRIPLGTPVKTELLPHNRPQNRCSVRPTFASPRHSGRVSDCAIGWGPCHGKWKRPARS